MNREPLRAIKAAVEKLRIEDCVGLTADDEELGILMGTLTMVHTALCLAGVFGERPRKVYEKWRPMFERWRKEVEGRERRQSN
jgi:hypothetical protein